MERREAAQGPGQALACLEPLPLYRSKGASEGVPRVRGTLGATLIARRGRGLLSRGGRTATPGGAAGAGGTTLGRRGDSGTWTREREAPCTRRATAPRLAAEEPGQGAEWQKVPWREGEGKAAAAGEGRAADLEYGTIDVHECGSEGAEEERKEEEAAPGVAELRLEAAPAGVAAAAATCRGRRHCSVPLE